MSRPTRAELDVSALRHNLARVREVATGRRVWAVVKANAYGHGLVRVAQALAETDGFAVASIDEALELRESGVRKPILLLAGFFCGAEVPLIAEHDLEVVVHHPWQVEVLERCTLPSPIRVWMKLDSGMHRIGFPMGEMHNYFGRLAQSLSVAQPVNLMTHLANADDRSDTYTQQQLERFFGENLPESAALSIANSGGILGWSQTHADWVRPGIMLYGVSPFVDSIGADEGLRPVMTLRTRLSAVNSVPRGEVVGYGGRWRCPEDMLVGVAAIGYGDGYPRHLRNGTPVLLNGRLVPLVGRVSMDMVTLDLRGQDNAKPGDEVVLWGKGLPVEEIARHADTIPYELVTRVTPRVRFELV